MDLSVVSENLGTPPTHIWKAGDERRTPKGTKLDGVRDKSYCIIDFHQNPTASMQEQLESILNIVSPHRPILENIKSTGGDISFYVGWFLDGDTGVRLHYSILSRMASLDLNVYPQDTDDEPIN